MVSPVAIILFGAGLLLASRLGAASKRENQSGAFADPPIWARRVFGEHGDRIQLDSALIGAVGLFWVVGGSALAVTGQTAESSAFAVVASLLVMCFMVGGLLAVAIWVRREFGRR